MRGTAGFLRSKRFLSQRAPGEGSQKEAISSYGMYRRLAFALLLFSCVFTDDVFAQGVRISHGPMLGHVTSDSIWIWARTSSPGQFQIRYGAAPSRLDQVSALVTTTADRDNTGWLRLQGLRPNTRYYYRPVTNRDTGEEGSFLTLPSPRNIEIRKPTPEASSTSASSSDRARIRSRAAVQARDCRPMGRCCGRSPIKSRFSIMNGDWLYEDKREFTVDAMAGAGRAAGWAVASDSADCSLDCRRLGKLQVLPRTRSESRCLASRDAFLLHA